MEKIPLNGVVLGFEKQDRGKEKKEEHGGWFSRKPKRKGADEKENPPAKRSHGADKNRKN